MVVLIFAEPAEATDKLGWVVFQVLVVETTVSIPLSVQVHGHFTKIFTHLSD
jgi:hypothetical protein